MTVTIPIRGEHDAYRKDFLLPADAGPAAFRLPADLPYAEWAQLGHALVRLHRGVQWWLGDWLLYGDHHYGEKYAQAASETGLSPDSLKRFQWVASRILPGARCPRLSFSHHEAVAALPPAEADTWLQRADRENLSSRDFRALVRAALPAPHPGRPDAAAGRLPADTPPSEDPMPTAPAVPGLRPTLARFALAIELALQATETTPGRRSAPASDSDLGDTLQLQLDSLTDEFRDRAGTPTRVERQRITDLAARLAALTFLAQDPDRLEFPGTADLAGLPGPEEDDDALPF